jgi:hypothetical protein
VANQRAPHVLAVAAARHLVPRRLVLTRRELDVLGEMSGLDLKSMLSCCLSDWQVSIRAQADKPAVFRKPLRCEQPTTSLACTGARA